MLRQLKTILCGTDFSEASYHALDYGLHFAKNSDGTLIVAHIIHVPAGDLFSPEHPTAGAFNFNDAKNLSFNQLKQLHASRLENYPKCELITDIGDPAMEILN